MPDDLHRLGHKVSRLRREAAKSGFWFADEDLEVLALMAETGTVIRARYIETGPFRWPAIEALTRTALSIQETARDELQKAGHPLR